MVWAQHRHEPGSVRKRRLRHRMSRGADGRESSRTSRLRRRLGTAYLRWRIFARIRRFLRPTLRRPLRFFIALPGLPRTRGWAGRFEFQPRQTQLLVEELQAAGDARDKSLCLRTGGLALGQLFQHALEKASDFFAVATLASLTEQGVQRRQLPDAPGGGSLATAGDYRRLDLILQRPKVRLKCFVHAVPPEWGRE